MLRAQVVDATTNQRANIEFFEDDTIETVRQRIGVAADTHPDRMFILIKRSRPKDFFTSDPRNWESLFLRLSYTSKSLLKEAFELYQSRYRTPTAAIQFEPVGKDEWMSVPTTYASLHAPDTQFNEYTVFGVPDHRSFVLPFDYTNVPNIGKIPTGEYPIPQQNTLFSSMYTEPVFELMYVKHEGSMDQTSVYFPFLRTTSPQRVSDEAIGSLNNATAKLKRIQSLNAPMPSDMSLVRTRFRVPWVNTDFGDAVQTRFEQIMYGQTVSQDVPYIGLFTGTDEIARHKFFTEDVKPYLNVALWKSWYNTTKPYRNRPTLLLYRGKSHHSFDRIAITSVDMIVTAYRSEKDMKPFNKVDELVESTRVELEKWFMSFDAVVPFIDTQDIQPVRWTLEETSALLKYDKKIEEYDLRRFPAFASIFDIADRDTSTFRLLRADIPVGNTDAKLIQLLRQRPDISVNELQDEMDIPLEQAQIIHEDVSKIFKGFPTIRIGSNTSLLSATTNLTQTILYANILRYVLGAEDNNEDVNSIGGKRMERVHKSIGRPTMGGADAEEDEYADLWDAEPDPAPLPPDLGKKEEPETELIEPEPEPKLKTYRKGKHLHNYFAERLREFDPVTFTSDKSDYPKKCEQDYQPIILSQLDLDEMNEAYDPRQWDKNRRLEIDGPDGTGYVICPEYWCMYDEIPLQEGQLVDESDGFLRCPMCKGKVQKAKGDDPRDFPVISRDKARIFPGYINKYKSPANGKPMPCCYKIAETMGDKAVEDRYYILGETKDRIPPKRIAFLPRAIMQSIHIPYEYDKLQGKKRILDGDHGFFRIGAGAQPSKVLPEFLGMNAVPRPRDVPERTLKCSFVSTWANLSDEPFETTLEPHLKRIVAGIDDAFMNGRLTPIQDLEYACIMLECDVFRLRMDTQTVECMFFNRAIYERKRAIIALQINPDDPNIDVLCHVTRKPKGFQFQASLYSRKEYTSPFSKETSSELEKLRNAACSTAVPSFNDGLTVMRELVGDAQMSIVLDPYGRAQAFYIPDKVLLPILPSPMSLTDTNIPTVPGFDAVRAPTYDEARAYLDIAKRVSPGFEWKEDVTNSRQERVELMLASGLRVPVQPQKADRLNVLEVTETIKDIGESELAFGPADPVVRQTYEDISYSSEVFDFLLFSLSKDLKDKYPELKRALQNHNPKRPDIEGPLAEWFNSNVYQSNLQRPDEFLSKIRTPCGQFKNAESCKGNVCGWNGNVCRIEVRKSLKKEQLFTRLLSTLVTNAKMRGIVLDGRSTPFFSTILYLEMPNELIITDTEVSQYV
jgi:hypothetical protein